MKILYILLFLLVFISRLSAQEPDDASSDDSGQTKETLKKQTTDTTKLRIFIKSMRSDLMSFDSIPFDTLLEDIHLQNHLRNKYPFLSHLGNLGLAAVSNNYFQQAHASDLFFINPIKYNFIHKDDILYYKTNHPYSNISYNSSGSSNMDLQSLRFLHTQNVNEKLNLGLLLNLHSSNGVYQRQKSTANALSLFSGYDGDYYTFNAVVSYNTLVNEESGGIVNDTLFENDRDKGTVYPTVLNDAKSNIRNSYVFISQRFNLAGVRQLLKKQQNDSVRKFSGIGLLHSFELDRNKRNYIDNTGPSSSFHYYSEYNHDSIKTNDSLYFFHLQNSVELLLGKQNPNEPPILIRAGIKSIYDKFNYYDHRDTVLTLNQKGLFDTSLVYKFYKNQYNNLAFTGGISIGIKSFFLLIANGDYFFSGYKAGDLYLHGKLSNRISKKPGSLAFNILMDISRHKPGYFYDRYFSNHFSWNNNFSPVKEIRAGIEVTWPAIKFDADFNYSLLSSTVYFDSNSKPQQSSGEMSVLEASISKGFRAGIFNTKFKTMLQITSNDKVVPLPLFSGYNSSYIELKLFKKVMTTQIGYDLRYNTAYYANGYRPDLGVFFNQREKKIGNYPFVDVFLNVKLKRMRFYLKMEHVNSDLLSRIYYTVLHYPVNSRMLMYGLSWNFYD